jgi:hypothetical protein
MVERREQEADAGLVERPAGPARVTSIRAPSCSSTSAEPQREVTERLPCLATGRPAAAAAKATAVETLIVPIRRRRCRSCRRTDNRAAGNRVGGAERPGGADQLLPRLALERGAISMAATAGSGSRPATSSANAAAELSSHHQCQACAAAGAGRSQARPVRIARVVIAVSTPSYRLASQGYSTRSVMPDLIRHP